MISLYFHSTFLLNDKPRTQCTYNVNFEAHSRNHCCSGKSINMKYSGCVYLAFIVRHAQRKRRIVLLSMVCLVAPYFFLHSLIKVTFSGTKVLNRKCVLVFYTIFSKILFILRRIELYITERIIYIYTQGVPGGMCQTLGECSLCQSTPI
jgi:hypothetical protein